MKIAIIDKAPSKNTYSKYFNFDFDLYHLSSIPLPKLLKKDIDIQIDTEEYDLIILVGSEASKEFAKVTSVTNMSGILINEKYICISNPAMLIFKPEGLPVFNESVNRIHKFVEGKLHNPKALGTFLAIEKEEQAFEYLMAVYNSNTSHVAMDCETTGLYPRDCYVLGISITYRQDQGAYISTDCLSDRCIELLQKILDKYIVVFHNMKFDIKMLEYHLNLRFNRSTVQDTMIMKYLLDENTPNGLKVLAIKHTEYGDYDTALETFKKEYCSSHGILEDEFTYDLIPFDIISVYAAMDTAVTWILYLKFKPIIDAKFAKLYNTIMIPGSLLLLDMEENGIPIDSVRMKAAEAYLDEYIEIVRKKIYSFDAVNKFEKDHEKIFNPNSVQQLRTLLFDYLGLVPTGKRTATGAISTDAEVLEQLAEQHELPGIILSVRQLTKIKNTYITKILPEIDKDGCIRTNFNLTFTTSGRLSSSGKFNPQQIIRDNPIIKGCIVAPDGYVIVSQDLATAEMYYAAVLSKDPNLQQVFREKGDFHSSIAKMVFDLPCPVEDVKKLYPEMRQAAKAISFGINL